MQDNELDILREQLLGLQRRHEHLVRVLADKVKKEAPPIILNCDPEPPFVWEFEKVEIESLRQEVSKWRFRDFITEIALIVVLALNLYLLVSR